MNNWLVGLAPDRHDAVAPFIIPDEIRPASNLDILLDKLASAETMGKELAHEAAEKEKTALALPGVGAIAGTAAKTMMRNPAKALRVGGAVAGGVLGAAKSPGVDPNTGQSNSRLMGGAIGAAAGYGAGSMAGKSQMINGLVKSQGRNLSQAIRPVKVALPGAAKLSVPPASKETISGPPNLNWKTAGISSFVARHLHDVVHGIHAAVGSATGAMASSKGHRTEGAAKGLAAGALGGSGRLGPKGAALGGLMAGGSVREKYKPKSFRITGIRPVPPLQKTALSVSGLANNQITRHVAVGAAGGAVLGGEGNRTKGAIVGGAAGGLIGKARAVNKV